MLRSALPYVAGFLSGLLASAVLFILASGPRGQPIELRPPPTLAPLRVHVAGAVQAPGVYPLPHGAIVSDALAAAGGPAADADLENVNLAAALADGSRVYLPTKGEATTPSAALPSSGSDPGESERIHINSATAPELERLPGIGPSLANAIVDYRDDYGPFSSTGDLLAVPGIGPAKLAAIEDLIVVP